MKKISKLITAFLMILLIGTGISMEAKAAYGELLFADPQTAVGEQVDVNIRLTSDYYLGTIEMNLSYDPQYLRPIVSSEEDAEITGGDGTINIKTTVEDGSSEQLYTVSFYALEEGSTNINVSGITVLDKDGDEMQITEGSSYIAIAAGDPSKIPAEEEEKVDLPEVHIDGVTYTIAEFADVEIPDGFERTSLSYEGQDCDCLRQENSGMHAFFLENDETEKAVFLYDGDTGSFTPMHLIDISSDNYIILLRDNENAISIDEPYQETTITIGGDTFPAWQNPNDGDYYLVYALNKDGKKTIYRYDSADKTYQRFAIDTESGEEYATILPETAADDFVNKNWKIFATAGIALILLLMLLLLVVRIKLARRDRELDDLYDEYGIDLEEEEEVKPSKKELKKAEKEAKKEAIKEAKKAKKAAPLEEEEFEEEDFEEENDEEEFEEYDEEIEPASEVEPEVEEEEFEEELEGEEFEEEIAKTTVMPSVSKTPEVRTPVQQDKLHIDDELSLDLEEDDEMNLDDDIIDDLDELLSIAPEKKRGHMEDDDTFKVDFIDLD